MSCSPKVDFTTNCLIVNLEIKNKKIKEIVIPDGVTAIEADTFNCCHSLESIVVGKGVRKFDSYALTGCSSL